MKMRGKILMALVAIAAISAVLIFSAPSRAHRELDKARRSLRQQGFKLDLTEFNLSVSAEEAQRGAKLATTTRTAITNGQRGPQFSLSPGHGLVGVIGADAPEFLAPAGADAAIVVWLQAKLPNYRRLDLWPEFRESLNANRATINSVREAAISGAIRFEPIGHPSPNALLPYLADIKGLIVAFGSLTALSLHDGDKADAWTNLLASTCLVTSYTPEPIEISHMVRVACATIAFGVTWNALQSSDWTEDELAELQRRWESVDFFTSLPDTAAFDRANMAGMIQFERRQPLETETSFQQAMRSPGRAWWDLKYRWTRMRYRHDGSYEDERALLVFYRDRELELRRAITAPNWESMRSLPGVTNQIPFTSTNRSRVNAVMNMRQISLAFQRLGQSFLGRAAEAEARRRLLITAIALERFHRLHGSYPQALDALVPELLKSQAIDFMDGMPLRYRRTDDGHFVLYSVGLDCIDNGGEMRQSRRRGLPSEPPRGADFRQEQDIVWPRPASVAEAEKVRKEERAAQQSRAERVEELQANE